MRKLLFNCSLYSHPEIGNFRVWQGGSQDAGAGEQRGGTVTGARAAPGARAATTAERDHRRYTTWKTRFGNVHRLPLVMGNAPVTDQVLQISQER
jgi:hypothetical protein